MDDRISKAGILHHSITLVAAMHLWEEGWAKGALHQESQPSEYGYLKNLSVKKHKRGTMFPSLSEFLVALFQMNLKLIWKNCAKREENLKSLVER